MADLKTTLSKLTNMKVAELRSELGNLGLEKQGTKMVLIDRLLKHYESSSQDGEGAPVVENGQKSEAAENTADDGGVVVDEVLDSTIDEAGVDGEEEEEEQFDQQDEALNEDAVDETGEADVEGEGENGEGQEEEVIGEDEEMEGDGEGEEGAAWAEGEDEAETQVLGVVDDEENEGDVALNISVEENEVLGIDQDVKTGEEDVNEEENAPQDVEGTTAEAEDDQDNGNNTSTTGKNEAESDNKAGEGETEVSEETTAGKESERHIILVTGLSSDTSANDLKTFFRKYGKIGRIKIMTNTRVPGSQRFAHISVPSLDELKYLVETLNGVQLKGKSIRVAKAPEDGSVSRSYEIAVATAKAEADGGDANGKEENGKAQDSNDASTGENGKGNDESEDVQLIKDGGKGKDAGKKDSDNAKKTDAEKKKEEKKETPGEKKTPEKNARPERPAPGHRPRKESHDRPRGEHLRPQRPFGRREKDAGEWKRHGPPRGPMEVTRVHRDRPPMGRQPPNAAGRRRSPHAQLTFDQIREIRDEQRRREHERRKREEERERAAEVERQKRLEYQNYMEFKQLEREREKLRQERERIEREKQELIKLERERQKAEREKIEREKEELRRAKLNIDHSRSSGPVKRPYEDEKVSRRHESNERKKPYVVERGRSDGKTEAERKMERERYTRERIHSTHSAEGRSRSPFRASVGGGGARESRRDVWARDEREIPGRVRNRSDERSHRRETEAEKVAAAERRSREAPSRAAVSSSDLLSRHPIESSHSSNRGAESAKRPGDRYDDGRTQGSRDGEWIQRSYLAPSSSLSLPMSTSASTSRGDSWPFAERKIEAWDTSRLAPRTEQWISGAGATVGATGRSSLPVMAPPPPLYSSASLALQGTGLGLGGYASADRYDGYRGGFHPLRKY